MGCWRRKGQHSTMYGKIPIRYVYSGDVLSFRRLRTPALYRNYVMYSTVLYSTACTVGCCDAWWESAIIDPAEPTSSHQVLMVYTDPPNPLTIQTTLFLPIIILKVYSYPHPIPTQTPLKYFYLISGWICTEQSVQMLQSWHHFIQTGHSLGGK